MTYFANLTSNPKTRKDVDREYKRIQEDEMNTKPYYVSLAEKRRLLCPRCDECGFALGGKRHIVIYDCRGVAAAQLCEGCWRATEDVAAYKPKPADGKPALLEAIEAVPRGSGWHTVDENYDIMVQRTWMNPYCCSVSGCGKSAIVAIKECGGIYGGKAICDECLQELSFGAIVALSRGRRVWRGDEKEEPMLCDDCGCVLTRGEDVIKDFCVKHTIDDISAICTDCVDE
jgi:hypothetical protein